MFTLGQLRCKASGRWKVDDARLWAGPSGAYVIVRMERSRESANFGRVLHLGRPMIRFYPPALLAAVVLAGGCTHATFGFRPSLTSQVPDSSVVRLRAINGQPPIAGRSLDWQTGRLRIVTSAGDTVRVPDVGTLEVRLNSRKSYAAVGGIVGVAVGMGLALSRCPDRRACGPDLRVPIGGGIGMLIGSRFHSTEWAVVKRPVQ
jgi:hypothetical protein